MAYPAARKNRVIALRLEGLSIPQIARIEKLSKSTIFEWVKNTNLPADMLAGLRLNSEEGRTRGRQFMAAKRKQLQQKIATESARDIRTVFGSGMSAASTRILAALLYWCEGGKRPLTHVMFMNSDPVLHETFLRLFRSGFEIDESKFRCLVHLHEYHDPSLQTKKWSEVTGIPQSQFTKPYLKRNTGKRKRHDYEGCLSIKYYDANIAKKLVSLYHAFAEMGAW